MVYRCNSPVLAQTMSQQSDRAAIVLSMRIKASHAANATYAFIHMSLTHAATQKNNFFKTNQRIDTFLSVCFNYSMLSFLLLFTIINICQPSARQFSNAMQHHQR